MRNSEIRVMLNCLRPAAGGNAVLATELARGLSEHAGVVLTVVTNSADADRWRAVVPRSDVLVRRTNAGPLRVLTERRELRAVVAEVAPSIVHDPVSLLPFLRLGVKTVVTIADLNFEELSLGAARTSYKRALYAHAARHADRLLCISEFTRRVLCRSYPIAAGKSHVVWCGHRFTEQVDAHRAPDSVGREPFLLTFAHRPHKNAEAAVRILSTLRERWPTFRLKIVGGDPHQQAAIQRLAAELRLTDAVERLSDVNEETLAELYRRAACLVFLSRYEGFGLPALEAMASGCPVVASDRGALPEVVGGHAPVFDCEDWPSAAAYITRLCSEPQWRARVCEDARRYAIQWTWKRAAEETVRNYRELLDDTGAAAGVPLVAWSFDRAGPAFG